MEDLFEENVVADPDTGSALAEEKKFLTESIVEGIEDCEGVWTGFQSADYLLAGKDVVLKQSLNFFFCHSIHPFAFVFLPQGSAEVGNVPAGRMGITSDCMIHDNMYCAL
jgi:hypothetical protein